VAVADQENSNMITEIFFYALITAGLSIFYDFITREGMLLARWYNLIAKLEYTAYNALFKVLGGCIYCNNPYLTAGFIALFNPAAFADITFKARVFFLISVIVINHLLLRIYERFDN